MSTAEAQGTRPGPHPAPSTAPDGSHPRPRPTRLPGLDGLRALAIAAVLLFHLDATWLPGGFLGVDVFFVVSGFLITTLLLRERAATGRIDLRGFWTRRARRLLPALLVLVPSSVLLARLTEGDLLVGIERQVLGAATFTSNWLEIAAGSDYFESTAPQLFMNLWSLAVEEQFYLLWPLALLALVTAVRRPEVRAAVALAAAVASALLMALRLDPDSPTRVYFGTDTHLAGLMLGAALAFAWAAPHRAWTATATWERHRRTVAGVALAVLGGLIVTASETSAWTFRGGIALASLATTALVLVVVERPGRLRAVLELPAARWVGARSYGIYLWHWPVVLVVAQDMPEARGSTAYVLTRLWALVVTLAVADLSYRFVEVPVRRRGFAGTAREALRRLRALGTRGARVIWGVIAVVTVATLVVLLTAPDRTSTEELIRANEAALTRQDPAPAPSTAPSTTASTAAEPAAAGQDWSMPEGREVDVLGDSMVVASSHALRYYLPKVRMDARSNRRWSAAGGLVDARGDGLRRAVVLAFGTNAGTDAAAVRRSLDAIGPDRMVVLVTLHGPFSRIDADNTELRDLAQGRENVAVADWDAALDGTRGQLQPDGIHPSLTGAHLYAKTIRAALAELSERRTGKPVTLKALPLP
ncbi:acyltransferase family protein [Oryzobacter terrae]|uniref:acyltransferase family protein n=1 Tax=Oryzobacter terrae TaxID=1620385 RepID=UPI00366ED660